MLITSLLAIMVIHFLTDDPDIFNIFRPKNRLIRPFTKDIRKTATYSLPFKLEKYIDIALHTIISSWEKNVYSCLLYTLNKFIIGVIKKFMNI